MRVCLAREKKHNLDIITFVGSWPKVCGLIPRWEDKLITEMDWVLESASPHPPPQCHNGSNMAAYLPTPSVDAKRRQKGVEDHVTGLYVDGWLPFSHRAKIPSWVHQSPERRNWKQKKIVESGWVEGWGNNIKRAFVYKWQSQRVPQCFPPREVLECCYDIFQAYISVNFSEVHLMSFKIRFSCFRPIHPLALVMSQLALMP